MSLVDRRKVLAGIGTATFIAASGAPGATASTATAGNKLVVVFLRGAMDGLHVFPAYADPDFVRERRGLAMPGPGQAGGSLALDGFFGIDPLMPQLRDMYVSREMLLVHAIASPYRSRSHFDAQHLLENGTTAPYGADTGWLNRALVGLPSRGRDIGVSVTSSMPVMMQGPAVVTNWSPSALPQPNAELLDRLGSLYETDIPLREALENAKAANAAVLERAGTGFPSLLRAAASFLNSPTGPRVAFLELGGFDSHANQNAQLGALQRNLKAIDEGVAAFRKAMGAEWSRTAILFVTEFGRTVAMNGSNGTDHGTAGAAFLLGGAVNGGRVIADWPGLKPAQQLEGRDLKPTADLRALFKAVLRDHLGVPPERLERDIFPSSNMARPFDSLFRRS
jgi:uncharacterized protein (DUF1501 family)